MRILMCSWRDTAHPLAGGAEVWTAALCDSWARAGHEVVWHAAAVPGAPGRDVRDSGVQVVRHGGRLGVYRSAEVHYGRETAAGRGYDVVVDQVNTLGFRAHRWATSSWVLTVAHQVAREVWWSEALWPVAAAGRLVVEPAVWHSLGKVPVTTFSESSARSMRDAGVEVVHVVPQAAHTPDGAAEVRARVHKSPTPKFVWCGRMVPSKRPMDAVEAFMAAREVLGGDAELVMVGDGVERHRVERFERWGVRCAGRVDEATKLAEMASSWAVLATSVREGWGLTVTEAAMVGTAAVGYAVDGLVDSVPAAGGVLVAPRPTAMARVLERGEVLRDTVPTSTGVTGVDELAAALLDRGLMRAPGVPGTVTGNRPKEST